MPRQSKANRRKTKLKQGLRNPNADRNDEPSRRDLKSAAYPPRGGGGGSGGNPHHGGGRRGGGMSRNEAWFSKWLANGKGSKKREDAMASGGKKRGRGGGGSGKNSHGSGRTHGSSEYNKRRKLTAREKWGGEHPGKLAKSKRKERRANGTEERQSSHNDRDRNDGGDSDGDGDVNESAGRIGSSEQQQKQQQGAVEARLRQPGESVGDFNARMDREVSRIIAGEEFASTKRSAKSKKYRRLMEAKRKKQAEQKRRRAANYDSEEEEWMAAAGGRDDAKFGERSEDAPRFRNKLDESQAFSFLSKKKVVTLMEGSGGDGGESGAGSRKVSQKDQMLRLRAQVVDAYRNRK